MTRKELREFMTDGFDGTYDFLESKADSIFDYFSGKTCSSCRYYSKCDIQIELENNGKDCGKPNEFERGYCSQWEEKD